MSDDAALKFIDYPGQLFDKSTELLAKVGVDLSPGGLQAILLLSCVAVLVVLWRARNSVPLWQLGAAGPLLVGSAILVTWLSYVIAPLPDHVYGRVVYSDHQDMRVVVVDFRSLPMGTAPVDTDNGDFGIHYVASLGDRPRTLIVKKPGCEDYPHPLGRASIRAGFVQDVNFRCKSN